MWLNNNGFQWHTKHISPFQTVWLSNNTKGTCTLSTGSTVGFCSALNSQQQPSPSALNLPPLLSNLSAAIQPPNTQSLHFHLTIRLPSTPPHPTISAGLPLLSPLSLILSSPLHLFSISPSYFLPPQLAFSPLTLNQSLSIYASCAASTCTVSLIYCSPFLLV